MRTLPEDVANSWRSNLLPNNIIWSKIVINSIRSQKKNNPQRNLYDSANDFWTYSKFECLSFIFSACVAYMYTLKRKFDAKSPNLMHQFSCGPKFECSHKKLKTQLDDRIKTLMQLNTCMLPCVKFTYVLDYLLMWLFDSLQLIVWRTIMKSCECSCQNRCVLDYIL